MTDQSMKAMIFLFCDAIAIVGGVVFLFGMYIAAGMAYMLMVTGLMLIAYAARLTWCLKQQP